MFAKKLYNQQKTTNSPSVKYPDDASIFFRFLSKSRSSLLVKFLNGWLSATMCMEKPNTKMARTAKNLAKSFSRSPMIMAHGPKR